MTSALHSARATVGLLGLLLAMHAAGQAPGIAERHGKDIDTQIARHYSAVQALYQDLHANPELAFTETRTASIVAAELKKLGYAVTTGIGKTGVVGVLKNGPGPTLWYRADMDANGGVRESTGLPWAASKSRA